MQKKSYLCTRKRYHRAPCGLNIEKRVKDAYKLIKKTRFYEKTLFRHYGTCRYRISRL